MKPPAGNNSILRHWREAGEWWSGEPYREHIVAIDSRGIRVEQESLLPTLGVVSAEPVKPYTENHREEWSMRIRKVRDEKVKRANGQLSDPPLPRFQHTTGERLEHGTRVVNFNELNDTKVQNLGAFQTASATYAALHCLSGYSFGRSTMLAEEIPAHAAQLGIESVLLADTFALTGAAEFVKIARKVGVKPLIGASFEIPEGGEIVLVAQSKHGFQSLSRLITECHMNEPRHYPLATWERLARHSRDLLCLTGGDVGPINRALMGNHFDAGQSIMDRLVGIYGRGQVYLQIERSFLPWQISVNHRLAQFAEENQITIVAGGPVQMAKREQLPALDVLGCVDTLCLIEEVIGRKPRRDASQPQLQDPPHRPFNAERFLLDPSEMHARFHDKTEWIENTKIVAARCEDDVLPGLAPLPNLFPDDNEALRELVRIGAHQRYATQPPALKKRIEREMNRIQTLGFANHFLIAWDMCDWATQGGVIFSGRGSVVDSVISYCLGFSRIDAFAHRLHFDRFLPADGSKRPDIDIDFEAAHRENIRQYLSDKYGRGNVATVAAIGAYCTRGIIREVGKVMGIPDDLIGFLSKRIHGGVSPDKLEAALDGRPELRGSNIPREKFRWVFRLAQQLMDMPRNMRAHSSGVIVSRDPICDYVPVMPSGAENVPIIQWDKRSAKRCFDKFDILCLRGNDVLGGVQRKIQEGDADFDVNNLPLDDPEVFRAFRSGALIGIPQSASPAMRQAHIRLKTNDLTDASLVQAGIRPGVGGAVKINELIARRRGKPYSFSNPQLEAILGNTYGIIVFQEQVDQLLQYFAGCTSGEAEDIRESIHKRRREGYADSIKTQIIDRIIATGAERHVAIEVCELICGFQGYGFAQGHALAFAEVSIRSVYCQQNFPSEYFAALLNAQPAGYYGPCTIVNEARSRGVRILGPDVGASAVRYQVEDIISDQDPRLVLPNGGIRIALSEIQGLSATTRERIIREQVCAAKADTLITKTFPFASFFDFVARIQPDRNETESLILCGAFDTLHPNRRALLWAIPEAYRFANAKTKQSGALPFDIPEPILDTNIEDFAEPEKRIHERRILGLDVAHHLMAFERDNIRQRGGLTGAEIQKLPPGQKVMVVGNPIRLRFPPTSSGKRVVFFDLEDETGLLNVTCFDDVYQRDGQAIVCSPYVTLVGETQDRDGHTAFLAKRVFTYRPQLLTYASQARPIPMRGADFLVG